MLKVLRARLQQGHRTLPFPGQEPVLPDRFRGLPVVDLAQCGGECRGVRKRARRMPFRVDGTGIAIDLGRCLFCTECEDACRPVPFGTARSTAFHNGGAAICCSTARPG